MEKVSYLILAINPGSTSTKVALYEGDRCRAEKTVRHKAGELDRFSIVIEQKELRMKYVEEFLAEAGIDPAGLDAVVGRGGIIRPIDSGTYLINEKMLQDLSGKEANRHPSALGGIIAAEIGKKYGIPAYTVDPVVVDEMETVAKLSGIPGIERRSVFHALNAKAVARSCAESLGIKYEDGRFIVAHMGGGISVGAHRYGRVIDVNDALSGEGPFSPERSGGVPLAQLVEMCYSGHYTKEEILALIMRRGGMFAYLGTNNLKEVEDMIRKGDEFAALVMDTMAYQVAKDIGAMSAVLEGRVNAIILTGGLAYSTRFTGAIRQRVDQIAPVLTRPGEDEMLALAEGVVRVLSGVEKAKEY
jgi:butyrate kinase